VTGYLARRIIRAMVILALASAITFFLFFALPGDPGRLVCGKSCNPKRLAEIHHSLGLDKSIFVQYWDFIKGIFVGRDYTIAGAKVHCGIPCFGYSYTTKQQVWHTLLDRFPATISLAIGGGVMFLIIGVWLGAVSALRAQSWFDRFGIAASLTCASIPIYVIGPLLQNIFVRQLHWLPDVRYVPISEHPWGWFKGLLIPWITLAIGGTAVYARLTRAQGLEALGEEFVRAGRGRGVSARTLHLKHTGRATLSPVLTVFGLDLAGLLSGAAITEIVFNIQGIGRLGVTSVQSDDLPMVMATVLVAAVLVLAANLIVDVAYGLVDPRVRVG
jgi:peptide/nickel transport system permease protein